MSSEGSVTQCKKCGKPLPAEAKFCNNCGTDVVPEKPALSSPTSLPAKDSPLSSVGGKPSTNYSQGSISPKTKSNVLAYSLIAVVVLAIFYFGNGAIQKHRGANSQAMNDSMVAAVNGGDSNKVSDLLSKGASPNSQDSTGIRVLTLASLNGQAEIVNILIAKGAELNATVSDGETALMAAAAQGHLEIVQALVKAGADVKPLDRDGWSAAEFATNQKHNNVADFLKQSVHS